MTGSVERYPDAFPEIASFNNSPPRRTRGWFDLEIWCR
jgi:hypothetical protein